MTTLELKNKVIGKINQTNDDNMLNDVYKILDNNFDDTETYHLSKNHKNSIDIAIEQIERGEFVTNSQANKDIKEWLNK